MYTFKSLDEAAKYFTSLFNCNSKDPYKCIRSNLSFVWGEAVLYHGKAVMFCGEVGSGKTTLITAFVNDSSAEIVSDSVTWIYISTGEKPFVFSNISAETGTGVLYSPLECVVYLTNLDDRKKVKRGFRRGSKKRIIDRMFSMLDWIKFPPTVKNHYYNGLDQLIFFEYNPYGQNPSQTYSSIKEKIDSRLGL